MPTLDRKDSDAKKRCYKNSGVSGMFVRKTRPQCAKKKRQFRRWAFLTLDQPGFRRSGCHETVQSLSFDMSFSWVVQS